MKFAAIQTSALVLLSGVSSVFATPASPGFTELDRPTYEKCIRYAPKFNELVPKDPKTSPRKKGGAKEKECGQKMQDFKAANGSLQCMGSGTTVSGGKALADAIYTACQKIIDTGNGNKWLEKGDPYTAVVKVDGRTVQFGLQITIGGFTVSHDFCVGQLARVMGCTDRRRCGNIGGCSWTTDGNLQSCIFL